MSISRPTLQSTPEQIFNYLNTEKDYANINQLLSMLRQNDYADNLNVNKPKEAILHALVTNDIHMVNQRKLAKAVDNIDPSQIIGLILEVIKLINRILDICVARKNSPAKDSFVRMLKNIKGCENPFINLGGLHLSHADLSGVDLTGANLKNARLKDVNLSHAKLNQCNCRDMVAIDTNLQGVTMHGADLSWSNLAGAQNVPFNREIGLKEFLKTSYPMDAALCQVPSLPDLKQTIQEIHDELVAEKLLEHNMVGQLKRKWHRHNYYSMLTDNIDKLMAQSNMPRESKETIQDLLQHHVFKDHNTARIASVVNSAVIKGFNMFHPVKMDPIKDPILGSPNQMKLISRKHMLEKQIRDAAHQPAVSAPVTATPEVEVIPPKQEQKDPVVEPVIEAPRMG